MKPRALVYLNSSSCVPNHTSHSPFLDSTGEVVNLKVLKVPPKLKVLLSASCSAFCYFSFVYFAGTLYQALC